MAAALSSIAAALTSPTTTTPSSFHHPNPILKCFSAELKLARNSSRFLPTTKTASFSFVSSSSSSSRLSASNRRREDSSPCLTTELDPVEFSIQEEIPFLLKLVTGSFIAAAGIKYGSIILPDITTPNLILALFMIFAPTALAALILLKASLKNNE